MIPHYRPNREYGHFVAITGNTVRLVSTPDHRFALWLEIPDQALVAELRTYTRLADAFTAFGNLIENSYPGGSVL
jgi:hypothetical protein